jgi:hypothetical protein
MKISSEFGNSANAASSIAYDIVEEVINKHTKQRHSRVLILVIIETIIRI